MRLSSGREVNANNGIIGINPDLHVYEGYDGVIEAEYASNPLTKEERVELADFMIALWTKFKEAEPLPQPSWDDEEPTHEEY